MTTAPRKFQVETPPRVPVDPKQLAAFAGGAETKEAPGTPAWTDLDDKRRTPAFSLRLTDKEKAMLKHIGETTPDSMHEFCIKAMRKAMDETGIK